MPPKSSTATSKQIIYKALRQAIIMGHRKPGERFNVDEIARQFATSVTPVRDALQMLSHEGLVTIKPRSGYFVTRTTLKELRDMLDLRRILETAAIERAALRITPEQLEQLQNIHAGYTGDDDASYDRYTSENRDFHYFLARASGNFELAEAIKRLHDRLARFMVLQRAGKSQEASHKRIVDCLKKNDVEGARQALVEEIDAARDAILDRVIQEEADSWHVGEHHGS